MSQEFAYVVVAYSWDDAEVLAVFTDNEAAGRFSATASVGREASVIVEAVPLNPKEAPRVPR